MFRPLTFLCMLVAAGAGYYLYQVKQSVAQQERELRDVRRLTDAAMERTQVLRAEWALLNEPDRLRQVVARHLTLEPMTPAQFVRFADLPRRISAPVVFGGAPSLFAAPVTRQADETAPVTLAAISTPAPAGSPAAARAAAPAPAAATTAPRAAIAPAQVAAIASTQPAATIPAPAASTLAPPAVIAARPEPEAAAAPPRSVPRIAAPRPATPPPAQVAVVAQRPTTQPVYAPPAAQQAVVATVSSTLGFSRSALPPPVPFGSARAATTQ
jgi:hypothetical protein